MPSVVHTFIVDKNAKNIKKIDGMIKLFGFYLFAIKHLWNRGIKFITAHKQSCLPQTIDKVSFAGNVDFCCMLM
jgi:hypothetical protein